MKAAVAGNMDAEREPQQLQVERAPLLRHCGADAGHGDGSAPQHCAAQTEREGLGCFAAFHSISRSLRCSSQGTRMKLRVNHHAVTKSNEALEARKPLREQRTHRRQRMQARSAKPASVEPTAVDPITAELVQARLSSIVREMRTIIIRTAYSRMIIEGHDFSSAVLTPQGDLVAASELEQPTHISALSWSARALIAKYGDDIGPGDLYLHNDPYTGGSHLNDVGLFYPVFRGERPLAIIGVMAHWQDVGGMVPGSLSGNAKDIYQEGIRIPSLRIARRGVWLDEVLELLFANVRQPDDRRGDLSAMEGACRIAERRLHAMADRFGDATVPVAFEALLARGERRMRDAIARLPDGVYAYQTYLDNSGESAEPLLLRLKLTVSGDEIHADFTGSAPQVAGPANLGPAPATTATFTMAKALLDPSGPINAGAQRPLKITAPLGSVVNARPPAACGAIGEVRRALESLVVGTLGMAIPERLVGDLKGASNLISIGGRHPTQQEDFLFVEFPAGGTGGTSRTDGNNSMRNFAEGDISSIQPIEAAGSELSVARRAHAAAAGFGRTRSPSRRAGAATRDTAARGPKRSSRCFPTRT